MKTYEMIPGLVQAYDKYTEEDFSVWKLLFDRQWPHLEQSAAREYLDGIKAINFTADKIPDFREVDEVLANLTGWSLVVVPGIIGVSDFFDLLAQKKFPATTWLRPMEKLDYLSEPDMFHDVLGHVPMLTNPAFCRFFEAIGTLGMQHIDKPEICEMLGRLYWFTAEFGLIDRDKQRKIYGAGLISSFEESRFCLTDQPTHLPFDVGPIMHHIFENNRIQDTYYVISSMEQLFDSLEEMEALIQEELN